MNQGAGLKPVACSSTKPHSSGSLLIKQNAIFCKDKKKTNRAFYAKYHTVLPIKITFFNHSHKNYTEKGSLLLSQASNGIPQLWISSKFNPMTSQNSTSFFRKYNGRLNIFSINKFQKCLFLRLCSDSSFLFTFISHFFLFHSLFSIVFFYWGLKRQRKHYKLRYRTTFSKLCF